MKIVFVSSWLPRWCGIAIYSDDLVNSLRKMGIQVKIICHRDGGRTGEKDVYPILDLSRADWDKVLLAQVEKIDPDLIHLQHEFGLYTPHKPGQKYDFSPHRSSNLFNPFFYWKIKRKPTVVTYHSVFSWMTYEESWYYELITRLATFNIVHEEYQKEALPKHFHFIPDNVEAIPHGSSEIKGIASKTERKIRGWDSRLVVGMIGFIEPNKGFEQVIKIWDQIVRAVPQAHLVIFGDVRPGSPAGELAKKEMIKAINLSPVRSSIEVNFQLFSPDKIAPILKAFDILVLPYNYASQSGNLARGYGAGLPVIVSGLEGLKSSVESSHGGVIVDDHYELKKALIGLLKSENLRKKYGLNSLQYVRREIDWLKIAARHLKVYHRAIKKVQDPAIYRGYKPIIEHV
jgi:glycosyltransferase involved in cell wall biosynthesis